MSYIKILKDAMISDGWIFIFSWIPHLNIQHQIRELLCTEYFTRCRNA